MNQRNRRPSPIQTGGADKSKRDEGNSKELNSPKSEDKENDENNATSKDRTPRSMEHAVDNIIAAGECMCVYTLCCWNELYLIMFERWICRVSNCVFMIIVRETILCTLLLAEL